MSVAKWSLCVPPQLHMISKLESLAAELIHLIALNLSKQDFCSLRLTSSSLNKKSLFTFSESYLYSVTTNLTEESLSRIEEISRHPLFSRSITTLSLQYDEHTHLAEPWERDDEGVILADSHLLVRLKGLVMQLPKCISFEAHCNMSQKDPSTWLRLSDLVGVAFLLVRSTGRPPASFVTGPERCCVRSNDTGRLQLHLFEDPNFKQQWSQLTVLTIGQATHNRGTKYFWELIAAAPNLKKLELRIVYERFCNGCWQHPSLPTVPAIEELRLRRGLLSEASLMNMLYPLRNSLRRLVLSRMPLRNGSWGSVFHRLQQNDFPRFEGISISRLTWISPQARAEQLVTFPDLAINPVVIPGDALGKKAVMFQELGKLLPDGQLSEPVRAHLIVTKTWRGNPQELLKSLSFINRVSYRGPGIKLALARMAQTLEPSNYRGYRQPSKDSTARFLLDQMIGPGFLED